MCIIGFSLFSSPHIPKMMTAGTLTLGSVGEQATLGCVRIKSGPSCCNLSNSLIRSPIVILTLKKAFRLGQNRFKNLSGTIHSTFNSAAEHSCSGTKIAPELAFPVWTGALFDTHLQPSVSLSCTVWTTLLACSHNLGVTHRPRGQLCPGARPGAYHSSHEVFVQGNYERQVTVVQHRVTLLVEVTFLNVNRLTHSCSLTRVALRMFISNVWYNFHNTTIFAKHKLVYKSGLETLKYRYSFRLQLMWTKFCVALVAGMIYFHNNIWKHWAIYSYFGYIHHFTTISLLLYCDSINDWSITGSRNHVRNM